MTEFTTWRSLVDGAEISAIPDSENLESAYIADDISGSQDDAVSTWEDSEGTFDATQATESDQPTLNTDDLNGLNTVSFDGGDFLDTGHQQDTNEDRSLYAVVIYNETGSRERYYGALTTDGDRNRNIVGKESDESHGFGYSDSFETGGTQTTGSFVAVAHIADSGTHTAYEDNSQQGSASYTGQGEVDFSDYIGAQNSGGSVDSQMTGKIAEILRYGTAHNSTTRAEVFSHLNSKYGLS